MADHQNRGSAVHREARKDYRWEGVDRLAYKEEGSAPFKDITRQVLITDAHLACEMRYFEMGPGGYSTLERHEHVHGVMIFRGRGHCLVGDEVRAVSERDLVTIPPWTWHQFRATGDEPFGFLCMVNSERDRPQLPSPEELEALRQNPRIAAFLDGRIRELD
ncbi:cupin domain-containing protein [Rhodoligotrophos ferricapiens]|uniref:cupin domain-containing protein n=1 Tax=Rhodoligotrophos ferricapiens TaxID=3069264 RepID=UPI00315C4C84